MHLLWVIFWEASACVFFHTWCLMVHANASNLFISPHLWSLTARPWKQDGWKTTFLIFGWSMLNFRGPVVFSLDLPRFTQEVCGSASNLPPDPNLTSMDTENWSEHHQAHGTWECPTSTLENEASDTCCGACAAWYWLVNENSTDVLRLGWKPVFFMKACGCKTLRCHLSEFSSSVISEF